MRSASLPIKNILVREEKISGKAEIKPVSWKTKKKIYQINFKRTFSKLEFGLQAFDGLLPSIEKNWKMNIITERKH